MKTNVDREKHVVFFYVGVKTPAAPHGFSKNRAFIFLSPVGNKNIKNSVSSETLFWSC